jgi:hypothetical protein
MQVTARWLAKLSKLMNLEISIGAISFERFERSEAVERLERLELASFPESL